MPPWYESQGRHYMAVMNLDRVFFCCLYGNTEDETIIRELHRDAAYEEELIFLERQFWKTNVQAKTPPPYLESSRLIVETARRYGGPADTLAAPIPMDASMTELFLRYVRLAERKKESDVLSKQQEAEIQRLRALLIDRMGPSCAAVCARDGVCYTATYKPTRRASIDKDSLARLKVQHPEIYEQFVTVSESRRFHVKAVPIQLDGMTAETGPAGTEAA